MTTPISFTVRPPASNAPYRPSPLANGSRQNSRAGPPSRRLFENGDDNSDDEDELRDDDRRPARDHRRDATSGASGSRNGTRLSGNGGSSSSSKSAAPLVIPALPNRDWRESSNRKVPSFKPEAPKREASDLETHERIGDGPAKRGLERFGKKAQQAEVKQEIGGEDIKPDLAALEGTPNGHTSTSTASSAQPDIKPEILTLEQQALAELLAGEVEKESAEDRAQRELVIAMQDNHVRLMSETEALQRDMKSLPAESTLEDFEAVPISAFGIAALRGMGWDPKSTDNVKAREVQKRPQLLGLGATPAEFVPPPGSGKSRKEIEREKEKREKKKTRDEKTGRGFVPSHLFLKTNTPTPGGTTPNGSGSVTPAIGGSRAGSETATDSDGSRRRRREDECGSERESKRRDERDRDGGRYETEEERARRKARERERDRDRDGDRYDRDRERDRDRQRDRDRDRDRDRRDRDRDRDGGRSSKNGDREKDRGGKDDDREKRRDRY